MLNGVFAFAAHHMFFRAFHASVGNQDDKKAGPLTFCSRPGYINSV
jgi:hypothetical protein